MTNLPPFGASLRKALRERRMPSIVHVMAGQGAWDRARDPSAAAGDCAPLVWLDAESGAINWPVQDCAVRIEVGRSGPGLVRCVEEAHRMIDAGATGVMIWWLDRDDGMPVLVRDNGAVKELELEDLRILLGNGGAHEESD